MLPQSNTDRSKIVAFALQNDPMRMGEGAFIGLCTQNNVKVVRGGTGFAVRATTCNSLVMSFLKNKRFEYFLKTSDSQIVDDYTRHAQNEISKVENAKEDIVLYLPDPVAALFSMGANKSVGLGGAEHELGHILCDKANKMTPKGFFEPIVKSLKKLVNSFDYVQNPNLKNSYFDQYIQQLAKFSNLFADIRLENMMPIMYPPTKQRFVDVQKCILELENEGLDKADSLNIIIVMMRDIGKNHVAPILDERFKFYKTKFKTEWDLVQDTLMPLVRMNQINSDDIDGTLHCPMVAAIELLIELKTLVDEQQQEPPQQPGDDKTQCPPQGPGGNQGNGQGTNGEGEEDDEEEKGEEGDGDADDEKEEDDEEKKGKGKDGKDGKDDDEDDDGKGKGKDDNKKNDKMKELDEKSDKTSNGQSRSKKDLVESIKQKLDQGDFSTDTLDKLQEKAEKEINKMDRSLGTKTYIPNGHKVVYIPRGNNLRG